MSDIENSDYYSDSSESDSSDSEHIISKKPQTIKDVNAARKFGTYIEDDSESENDDSEPDDADNLDEDEQEGGGKDDDVEEEEIKENDDIEENNSDEEQEEIDDEDDDIEIDEEGVAIEKQPVKTSKPKKTTQLIIADDEDEEDEYEENYLQKFDNDVNKNYISEFHPECLNHNSDEVSKLSKVIRDDDNNIIDPLHRTLPFLTKYEKARILGQRAKQIETGAKPFVRVPENIIDSYVIAELELKEKKIPFIIKRPIPGGAFEYWNIKDLENINF
jgi:DNA-directed RNA polymerase I, II, and III subunit RPABC2